VGPPDAGALGDAVVELAAAPLQRERLAQNALETVRERTWERALGRLAEGYRRALGAEQAAGARHAA
jgi:glycosyltransferase involved in cell wall biosynthesis